MGAPVSDALPGWPRRQRVDGWELAAVVPVAFSVALLPFLFGGRYPGWLDAAEALTFGAALVLLIGGRLNRPHGTARRLLTWSLAAAAAAAVVSSVVSEELATSVPVLLEWLWLGGTALLVGFLAERGYGRDLLAVLLLGAVSTEGAWAFYLWWGSQDPRHAQVGTFYAANQYAGYVLLLAPLFLALCLVSSSHIKAAGAGFLASFLYLGVALSGSRAGVLAAAAGFLATATIVALGLPVRTLLRTALVAVGVVGLGIVLTSPLLFPAAKTISGVGGVVAVKGEDPADLTQRLHWDLGALEIGLDHPLTGSGLGTFGDVFFAIQKPEWQWSKYAHNQYLEAFAEGGALLLAAMMAIPLIALAGGVSALWGRVTEADFARLGLWGGLVGGSLHLLVDHDWSYPAYAVTFVVAAVLVVHPMEIPAPTAAGTPRQRVPTGRPLRRPVRLGLTAVAALCLAAVGGQYLSNRLLQGGPAGRAGRLHVATLLAPYAADPFEKLALLDVRAGDTRHLHEAARLLGSAIARDELDPNLQWELAAIETKLGNLPAARREYRAAIEDVPLAAAAYLKAAAFEEQSAHDGARASSILAEGITRIRLQPSSAGQGGALNALNEAQASLEAGIGAP